MRSEPVGAVGKATLDWAAGAAGLRRVLAVIPISVSSTAVHRVEAETRSGAPCQLILRRFVDLDRLREDPWYVPAHEAVALELLARGEVPAPRLIAADPTADECEVPTLLTTCVQGASVEHARLGDDDVLEQLAAPLPAIHSLDAGQNVVLPDYAPYYDLAQARPPSWTPRPQVWEAAVATVDRSDPPVGRRCFIHRDYHDGNVLFDAGRLSGVVDWTTASFGPAAVDLARMRQNLARNHGLEATDRFLAAHRRSTGRDDHHPWWDLRDALDMVPDIPPPCTAAEAGGLERWEQLVERASAELGLAA